VEGYVDDIAERAVQLGGVAEGTAMVATQHLAEYPTHAADGRSHVEALSSALAAVASRRRQAIEEANELRDLDTADLVHGGLARHRQVLWFVEAHLQAER